MKPKAVRSTVRDEIKEMLPTLFVHELQSTIKGFIVTTIKEILPQLLVIELEDIVYQRLEHKLKDIEQHTKKIMEEMNTRNKDTMEKLIHASQSNKDRPSEQ